MERNIIMRNVLLLLAGGISRRTKSSIPKQFVSVNSEPIFIHTIRKFEGFINKCVIITHKNYIEFTKKEIQKNIFPFETCVVEGGDTGLSSMIKGLNSLEDEIIDLVFVHDACRPFVDRETIENCSNVATKNGYAFSAAALVESILDVSNNSVKTKDNLKRIMSPHCFKYDVLNKIVKDNQKSKELTIFNLFVAQHYPIIVSDTYETNLKITSENDLKNAITLLSSK